MPIASISDDSMFNFRPDLIEFLAWRLELQQELLPPTAALVREKENMLRLMDEHANTMMNELGIEDFDGARRRLELTVRQIYRAKLQAKAALAGLVEEIAKDT